MTRLEDELFDVIKDRYEQVASVYKDTYGQELGTEEELRRDYRIGINIIERSPSGEVQGFLNYIDHGDWLEPITLAVRKELRGTFRGSKLACRLAGKLIERRKSIDLVLLKLETGFRKMAEKSGFMFIKDIDDKRILLRRKVQL
jgi:hypothetical protein